MSVRTRIAPSPTGQDVHIGNVYTALLNYVFAKKHHGQFIIRIEDTDRTRRVEGAEEKILASLKWFGLTYAEGPDVGGPFAPYRQSERKESYREYAEILVEKGHAFYCFCTSERLEQMRLKQQENKQPTIYDGFCKTYSLEKAREKAKTESYVIRLNVPEEGVTTFHDVIRGDISFENALIDDQVLLKSDGYPTYHLGVVVDDHLMGISHVIRAEEWISSTPKHVLLYQFFCWELPVFAHGPILRNPDKSKLSKRKNPVWASWYKEQGFLPEAILNYLGTMGWSMPACAGRPEGQEIFTLDEMAEQFELKDLRPVGPAFDLKKLEWMNGEYIRKSSDDELIQKLDEFYEQKYSKEMLEKTVPLIKERIKVLSEYREMCEFFYTRPESYEIELETYTHVLNQISVSLDQLNSWTAVDIGAAMQQVATEAGMKNSEFFMMLRVVVTGKKISPPLNESMELLGKEEVIHRINSVLN